jgi:hypothetical protein
VRDWNCGWISFKWNSWNIITYPEGNVTPLLNAKSANVLSFPGSSCRITISLLFSSGTTVISRLTAHTGYSSPWNNKIKGTPKRDAEGLGPKWVIIAERMESYIIEGNAVDKLFDTLAGDWAWDRDNWGTRLWRVFQISECSLSKASRKDIPLRNIGPVLRLDRMPLKVYLDINIFFLVYEWFSLWMLNSFSFSPLDLVETEQLSPGQKVEFSGHPLNQSENSRAIPEIGPRHSERGILANFTHRSRCIFSGHSDREGPSSRVRGSRNSLSATRSDSPRTLLETNF